MEEFMAEFYEEWSGRAWGWTTRFCACVRLCSWPTISQQPMMMFVYLTYFLLMKSGK